MNPIFNSPMYVRETDTVALMTDWFHTCFLPALADLGFLLLYNTHTQTHILSWLHFKYTPSGVCPIPSTCIRKGRERAEGFTGEQAFPHIEWCGHPKSHLDHCCFVRKGHEFAPQQMSGPQSQLGRHTRTHTHTHMRARTHTLHFLSLCYFCLFVVVF